MVAGVGLVLGPVLGGALVQHLLALGLLVQRAARPPRHGLGGARAAELVRPEQDRRFDWLGTLTFVVGLTGLTYGISRGGLEAWSDAMTVGPLIAAVVLLPALSRRRAPGRPRRCST